jgi:fumarate hydratase class II/aspartate ammonia-lyase
MNRKFRVEKDSLGEYRVPEDAWYGVQTARAVENFPISGRRPDADFIIAHVRIKRAAAAANHSAGWLEGRLADAVADACDAVIGGAHHEQFVVDRFQAGAGTSHNMNTNEVLANLANVALGGRRGEYRPVHPNDHVNMGQSTNDTIPTAIRLAALAKLPRLLAALHAMSDELEAIGAREAATVKSGRTHLQDAVPTTLGREFRAYAWTLRRCAHALRATAPLLCETGLGGSAAGTGLNTAPGYTAHVAEELARLTGEPIRPADDLAAQMQSMHDLQALSNAIRATALELTRIANDLRLLASGPRTGLAEIELPAVQPGSSIMPGKVNPVLAEMLNMVCFHVMGNDLTVMLAGQAGQLELNVMMPVIAYNLFQSMDILIGGVNAFTEKCVRGITANREKAEGWLAKNAILVTALNPVIGYLKGAEVAKEAMARNVSIKQVVIEKGYLSEEDAERILGDVRRMTEGGIVGGGGGGG